MVCGVHSSLGCSAWSVQLRQATLVQPSKGAVGAE